MYKALVLPYTYGAFSPKLSGDNLKNHYEEHYLKYLNKLNQILVNQNFSFLYPVSDLYKNIDAFPISVRDDILFQAGGVVNHELYFQSITPRKVELLEPLRSKIIQKYGSVSSFEEEFFSLATSLPGSGYAFLAVNRLGDLVLLNLPNQDSPYLYGMKPILAFDVWEHSYYIDYRNHRDTYTNNLIPFLDYKHMNELYKQVLSEKSSA